MTETERLRQTLARIAELAKGASQKGPSKAKHNSNPEGGNGPGPNMPACTIKTLPRRLLIKAAATAMRVNPVNAPMRAPAGAGADFGVTDPMRIAVLTSKYWGPTPRQLTVSFLEDAPADLRARIVSHMNAWTQSECISFAETEDTGDVRITLTGDGYWSYLGTDILHIPQDRPTMCLQDFNMDTPESEYKRVVRHETGHTLGFPHEHMRKELIARIDPDKAYQWFWDTYRWTKEMVDAQVLTPLDDQSIMGTQADQTSIMCYQLPADITTDGEPIIGGTDINSTDYAFAGRIYPKPGAVSPSAHLQKAAAGAGVEEWPESEDVEAPVGV